MELTVLTPTGPKVRAAREMGFVSTNHRLSTVWESGALVQRTANKYIQSLGCSRVPGMHVPRALGRLAKKPVRLEMTPALSIVTVTVTVANAEPTA